MSGGIFDDIFGTDGEQQSPESSSPPSNNCTGILTDNNCSGTDAVLQVSSLQVDTHAQDGEIVRSPAFLKRETSLINLTIQNFDWGNTDKYGIPLGRRLAWVMIHFPSLRTYDGSAVADLINAITEEYAAAGEEVQDQFEVEFDAMRSKVPTFSTPQFAELVKAAVDSHPLLPVLTSGGQSRPTFTRAVNAVYRWQELQGWGKNVAIPAGVLKTVLGHEDDDYANVILRRMVQVHFLELIAAGGPKAVKRQKLLGERVNPRMPSTYQFIGRVVDGVIVPATTF